MCRQCSLCPRVATPILFSAAESQRRGPESNRARCLTSGLFGSTACAQPAGIISGWLRLVDELVSQTAISVSPRSLTALEPGNRPAVVDGLLDVEPRNRLAENHNDKRPG